MMDVATWTRDAELQRRIEIDDGKEIVLSWPPAGRWARSPWATAFGEFPASAVQAWSVS